jgi:hypothetical protein
MLEQLTQFIMQNGGQDAVVNNTAVPNEHNNAVMQEAGSSIMSVIGSLISSGQESQVAQMAQDPGHPAVQQAQSNFAGSIMEKFGINGNTAKHVAASLIPVVLGALANRNSNAGSNNAGGFNLSSLVQSLAGGSGAQQGGSANAISAIGGALGLDKDGDGDVDLGDVTKMIGL